MIRLASSTLTPSSRLSEPELSAKGPPITNVPVSIRASMNSACSSQPGCSRTPPLVHVGPARQTTTTRIGMHSAYALTGAASGWDGAVANVRHARRLEHLGPLEPGDRRPDAVEEPGSAAQQHRGQVEQEVVDQAGVDRLVDRVRSACDQDILLGRGGARILDRALEALGDEGEGGPFLHHEWLTRMVGEHEDGLVKRWVVSPPAVRVGVVLPGPFAAAEHTTPHHDGAGRAQRFRDELVVRSGLSAGEAVGLAPALERKDPLVQLVSPLAKRILECRARPGDVAVERDRNFRDDLAHLSSYEVSVAAA